MTQQTQSQQYHHVQSGSHQFANINPRSFSVHGYGWTTAVPNLAVSQYAYTAHQCLLEAASSKYPEILPYLMENFIVEKETQSEHWDSSQGQMTMKQSSSLAFQRCFRFDLTSS
eukprot:scaffold21258_cov58-Cyclotella_meneghiniana.AAC.2